MHIFEVKVAGVTTFVKWFVGIHSTVHEGFNSWASRWVVHIICWNLVGYDSCGAICIVNSVECTGH